MRFLFYQGFVRCGKFCFVLSLRKFTQRITTYCDTIYEQVINIYVVIHDMIEEITL